MTRSEQDREKEQFWRKMEREKKQFWKKLSRETARAAKERARHRAVTGQSQSSPWMGCAVLFGVFALFSVVLSIIEAIERTLTAVIKLLGISLAGAVGVYLSVFLLVLILGPLADWLRRLSGEWQQRKAAEASLVRSPFPRHRFLLDERYLDSVIWRMIDFHLGQETVRLRNQLGFVGGRNRRIAECIEVREALLRDREFFDSWKLDNLGAVLRNPYNQPALTGIYSTILKRLRNEAWGREQPTELLEIVGFTIVHDPEPAHPWYSTRSAVRFLTWGRVCGEEQETALVGGNSDEYARLKVRSYLAHSERFRRFMERYFFEIMGELDPFEFHLPKVHRVYQRDQEQHGHYALSLSPRQSQKEVPARSQSTIEAEELEAYKRRAADLTQQAKTREKRVKKLRKRFLPSPRPEVLYSLYCEGRADLAVDIRFVLEQGGHDTDAVMNELEDLASSQAQFLEFWKTHEADILEAREARISAQAVVTPEEELAVWQEGTLERALAFHRAERERLRTEEYVELNPEFGYLLAISRERVRQNLPDGEHGDLENYLERELRRLLTTDGAEERYFGDAVRQALVECEDFRQGELRYGEAIRQLGYEPDTERDPLALAFVESGRKWRRRFRRYRPPVVAEQPQPQEEEQAPVQTTAQVEPMVKEKPEELPLQLPEDDEHLLTERQAGKMLQVTPRALQGYRYKGGGPPFIKLSARAIRYRLGDLKTWVSERLRSSTSEPEDDLDPEPEQP